MRRLSVTFLLCALVQALVPTSVHAWFGSLDRLSGPGRFKGAQFEFRLACFGDDSHAKKLDTRVKTANRLLVTAAAACSVNGQGGESCSVAAGAAAAALVDLADEVSYIKLAFPFLFSKNVSPKPLEAEELRALALRTSTAAGDFSADSFKKTIEALDKANLAIISTGVAWSVCSNDKERRSSIDVGVNSWRADGDERYAGNNAIQLTMLMPMFSWRVFRDPRFDVLDAGFGGGVYWFSSPGFKSFSGIVLQPGRFDAHAPTSWSTYDFSHWKRWAAIPTVRYGFMTFPSGFEADAFAGVGDRAVRIPAELNQTASIFVNLESILRRTPPR